MTFHEACQAIIDNRNSKALNYAVNYARYGLTVNDPLEQYIQSLYILNNMKSWRGELAREVRVALKSVGRE